MKILTLGPEGTFSSEAAQQLFPNEQIIYAPNFDAMFLMLEEEPEIIGIVPIENSLHGSVHEVLDFLYRTKVRIWQVHDLRIRHAIGALKPGNITRIASHPQALAQCSTYLREHYPDAERFPVSSTRYAIDLARENSDTAAIAPDKTLEKQGFPLLDRNIEGSNNTTRFAVVGVADPYPGTQRTHTSIVLHPHEDRPGLLHALITPFKVYDVNMSKIESRPSGEKLGDYIFFIDFNGTEENPRVQQVFAELRPIAAITVLGIW